MRIKPRPVTCLVVFFVLFCARVRPATAQSVAEGERKHGICASCHGIGGRSFKPHYPILAGQPASYIRRQLQDFKQSKRSDPNMDAVVPQLSDEDIRDLSAFFASRKPYWTPIPSEAMKAVRRRSKARSAHCEACHLPGRATRIGESPRIRRQHPDYLMKQLRDFRSGRRSNDGGVMRNVAQSLSDADIEDLSYYFARTR